MIDDLSNYAISIIFASFLMNFVQMILPNSHMRKYVIFVCGVIITIILIHPVISFFHKDINVSQILKENEALQIEIEEKKYEEEYEGKLISTYKQNIEEGIQKRLEQIGYKVHDIEIEYDEMTLEPKFLKLTIESSNGTIQPVRVEVSSRALGENGSISSLDNFKIKSILQNEYGFERIEING